MELPQSNTLLPVCSYIRTELLSLRTKTSLLSLSTVDRLKNLNIGYHLSRRHRSSRGVKRKKHNLHSFIVASLNAQSVKGNDMACKRCEISTFIEDNVPSDFLVGGQVSELGTVHPLLTLSFVSMLCLQR